MDQSQTNVKTESARGLGRKTREKVEKGNQTALGFQTVGWGWGGVGGCTVDNPGLPSGFYIESSSKQ